ncbi:MAG: glycyl-radical enzyme activating protein [Candidatus Cloacimonetes bacterium]|nr:glycyl-radical enzyme activating protein [Candidatus Cloacimonadota bacterium]
MNSFTSYKSGLISDVQRFSLHDGPGIRTTVFLKGCPLNCKWCHNPETRSSKPQFSFSESKCENCFRCVDVCPTNAHYIEEEKHKLNFSLCDLSRNCVSVCPNDALRIIGNNKSIDEVMNIVLRDKDYYKNSGGGLTISGGEPMNQFSFTRDLLNTAKLNGIHTVLETCGYAPKNRYLEIAHMVDLILFDYKETDTEKHREFTGVDNNVIRENLKTLHDVGANIILRCPIIPGVNDNEKHFKGIADLVSELPNLKGAELMAYHDIGRDKAEEIGMENEFYHIENATEEMKQNWLSKLQEINCETVKYFV